VLRGESQTHEVDAASASDGLDIGGFGHFDQSVTECMGCQSIEAIALTPVAITPEEIRDFYPMAKFVECTVLVTGEGAKISIVPVKFNALPRMFAGGT
jgi:hypothetical protein